MTRGEIWLRGEFQTEVKKTYFCIMIAACCILIGFLKTVASLSF